MEHNPWQIISQQQVYTNPWISLIHHQVINPAGKPGIYGLVHFKNVAVGVVPVDEQGNTWLVGQYRFTLNAYSWEIPEGGCPAHEDPLAAAQRELLEETGLTASHYQFLQRLHLSNSVSNEVALLYLATGLTQGPSQPEDTELLQIKKLPLTQAIAMAQNGQITDAMSVAALLFLKIEMLEGRLTLG
ncbi:MAG TPA: NUDIX hydrolase [Phnomibacter sp.]|nr:NUDIX hydrolase [Phnomibacter sp.]